MVENWRQFGGPSDDPGPAAVAAEKPKREKKPKAKADPKLVSAARELRDRWLEQVNSGAYAIEDAGKYDVTRALPSGTDAHAARQRHLGATAAQVPLLPAA